MSMLTMTGTLLNVFKTPEGKNKEGESFGGNQKIQVLGSVFLQNGEERKQLIDLTCHEVDSFEPLLGEDISFPVGVMSPGKNQTIFFIPRGSKPAVFKPTEDKFGGASPIKF
jgi:hypothetical protein